MSNFNNNPNNFSMNPLQNSVNVDSFWLNPMFNNFNNFNNPYSRNLQMQDFDKLCILIIDINVQNSYFNVKDSYINLNPLIPKMQISGYSYNDHLLITSTFISPGENNYNDDSRNYFSLFMIFGYANGTDRTIDISGFFTYNENDENYPNFCEILYQKTD